LSYSRTPNAQHNCISLITFERLDDSPEIVWGRQSPWEEPKELCRRLHPNNRSVSFQSQTLAAEVFESNAIRTAVPVP